MLINVIGLGYIGLPTALIMAKSGLNVVGTDHTQKKIDKLNNGEITFSEDGLQELFSDAIKNNIKFSTEYQEAEIYIVAVPTPYIKETKKIDPSYVQSATKSILKKAKNGSIIVIESTISPGTIDNYIRPIIEETDKKIHIAHAPERIIPGNMIKELVSNSRTIGADSIEIAEKIKSVYNSFCEGEIILTDVKTAEISKVVENTYRDINIAFANELSRIAEKAGLDVFEIIRIANKHPRVNILNPGPGVGGHCISVDPWFLVGDFPDDSNLIRNARIVNDDQPFYVFERLKKIMNDKGIEDFSKVGIYGLTYKEDVDDMRESPTLQLLEKLSNKELEIKSYDPFVMGKVVDNQVFSIEEFLDGLEIILVMVGHSQIRELEIPSNICVLDTRRVIKKRENVYYL